MKNNKFFLILVLVAVILAALVVILDFNKIKNNIKINLTDISASTSSTSASGTVKFNNNQIYNGVDSKVPKLPCINKKCNGTFGSCKTSCAGGYYPDSATAQKLCQMKGYDTLISFTKQYGFYSSCQGNYMWQWDGTSANYISACKKNVGINTITCKQSNNQSTIINFCTDISKPGTYSLGADITNTVATPCINIHDTNNVNFDCQNHSVESNGGNYAIYFNNVNNFSINNCIVQPITNHTSATQVPMMLLNSSNGTLSNLNVSAGPSDMMEISNSNKITVSGSKFTGLEYLIYQSNFINTKNNTFSATTAQGGVVVDLQGGNNNSVVNNNIDGMSDGIFHGSGPGEDIGVDDDIVISDEKLDLISGNNLKNNWDCGIENGGYMYDSQIINNKIDNVGVAGIGGWYYLSMKGNIISGNIVTNAPELFLYFRDYDLRPSVEPVMYFENNNFASNTLTSQKTSARSSTNINIFAPSGLGGGFQFPDFTNQQVVASNNIIKNNNFGTLFNASFSPSNIFVDGGGNLCLPSSDPTYPIKCKIK
ncbi:MAG: hypothetical protein ABSF55_00210 [Candidatus Staskawiczbacteria bacterium]|jgi:hypothetical protein